MALRIRRGTEAQRLGTVAELGELLWVTDQKKLYVGTGATNNPGNASMANILETSCGPGISWNALTQQIELGNFAISSDDITEGLDNLFYTNLRAQGAAASLFTTGAHTGIGFVYNDVDGAVNATVSLSLNNLSNVNISGTPSNGQILKYDTATSKWVLGSDTDTGLINVVDDTSPSLGGNLDLNTHSITGTGSVAIDGTLTAGVTGSQVAISSDTITKVDLSPLKINIPENGIVITGTTSGTEGAKGPFLKLRQSQGTIASPTSVLPSDWIGGIESSAWNGTKYAIGGYLTFYQDPSISINPASDFIPTVAVISVAGSGTIDPDKIFTVDSRGIVTAPILRVGSYATADLPTNPSAGMIVYDSQTEQYKGYKAGTTNDWIVLG